MRKQNGFTLIELLVVISIMGILLALSIFGLQGARQASRDGKRKADLEQIRSALEMYKADCSNYPPSLTLGGTLAGDGSSSTCSTENIYMTSVPVDPLATSSYRYSYSSDGLIYELCASLEQGGSSVTCTNNCGGGTCNYKVINP